jgi:hypothetical protein
MISKQVQSAFREHAEWSERTSRSFVQSSGRGTRTCNARLPHLEDAKSAKIFVNQARRSAQHEWAIDFPDRFLRALRVLAVTILRWKPQEDMQRAHSTPRRRQERKDFGQSRTAFRTA